MFTTYNFRSVDDNFDTIVSSIISSAKACYEGVVADRSEQIRLENEAVVKYALEGTRFEGKFEAEGLKVMKNPQITKNEAVRSNFDAIIAQIINAVAPSVANATYSNYLAEVVQVGWGDTARFLIKSNDLFKVNEIAEGVNRGVLQPIYNDEITVNCSPVEIATSIDWYAVAAGVFDWGDFAIRAGKSFEGYIFLKVVAQLTALTATTGAYVLNGFSNANWNTLLQKVSAANGGSAVYGMGTLSALSYVFPNETGLQYGLGKEIADKGYLDKFFGARLIPIDNVLVPGTTNTSATLAIPDNRILLIPAAGYKPVKVVFEGDSTTIERIPEQSTDKTYAIRIQMRLGIAAIVGSKFGAIQL